MFAVIALLKDPHVEAHLWKVDECEVGTPAWRVSNMKRAMLWPLVPEPARGLYRAVHAPAAQPGEVVLVYRGLTCIDADIDEYDLSLSSTEARS
jgi:hypothetical protein